MEYLFLFLLASAGMTIIVTKSLIFKPIRDYFSFHEGNSAKDKINKFIHKLLTCPLCFGFHAGIITVCLMHFDWGMWICYGFASSFFAWFTWKFAEAR